MRGTRTPSGVVVAAALLVVPGCSGSDSTIRTSSTTTSTVAATSTTAAPRPEVPLGALSVDVSGWVDTCAGEPLFVTLTCRDPELATPYLDVDEMRTTTDPSSNDDIEYRYVHGGFEGTDARFSFAFPSRAAYVGRFFEMTYPTVTSDDAMPGALSFALSHGAYSVVSNNAGGMAAPNGIGAYRANAAAAKVSRLVAAQVYGVDDAPRGYLYGASGGAYQTVGGLEHSAGVWDGGVPMVPGTPNAIPSNMTVGMLVKRVLGDRLASVVDALEPGGSGDPYAGLTAEQVAVLHEATAMGFPLRGWWQWESYTGGAFTAVAGAVKVLDPTYNDDFWTQPGYAGTDPAQSAAAARVQVSTTVQSLAGGGLQLRSMPVGDLFYADVTFDSGSLAGQTLQVAGVADGVMRLSGDTSGVAAGDRLHIDNSWAIALQYYQRYALPKVEDHLSAWDQFRNADGTPKYPTRAKLVGNSMARASGGIATGDFHGKMIMLASVLDVQAFAWSADWYRQQASVLFGDALDDNYRLWFMDNTDHQPLYGPLAATHVTDYNGEMQQALLDLDEWVRDGVAPATNSAYSVSDDNQVVLEGDVATRGGLQPLVSLLASDGQTCDGAGAPMVRTTVNTPVTLCVSAATPAGVGEIRGVDVDRWGGGNFTDHLELAPSATFDDEFTVSFEAAGTYFVTVSVTANRGDDCCNISNLARVRVVVD